MKSKYDLKRARRDLLNSLLKRFNGRTRQQQYFFKVSVGKIIHRTLQSMHTGQRWQQLLMLRLWAIAVKLWEHSHSEVESNWLPEQDQYLTVTPLQTLQAKGIIYKKEWIHQAELALSAQQTWLYQVHLNNVRRRNPRAPRAASQRTRQMMNQMRSTMNTFYLFIYLFIMSDNRRILPFHHECLNASCSVDILILFLQFYPDCIANIPS